MTEFPGKARFVGTSPNLTGWSRFLFSAWVSFFPHQARKIGDVPTSDAATRISDVLTRRQRLSFFPSSAGFFFPAAAYIFFRTHIRARREGGFRFVLNHGFFFPYSIDLLLTRQTTGAYIFSPMDEHTGYIPAVQQTSIPATQADVNSCHSSRRQFLPLKEGFPQFPYLAVSFFRPRQLSRIDKHHNHRSTLSTRWARTQGRVVLFCFRNAQQNRRNNLLIPSQKHSVDTSGDGTDPMESRSPFGFRVPPNKSQKFC